MSQRNLYLAAYDISHMRRARAILHVVRGYATGGQKSVHEAFLTASEKGDLIQQVALLMDEETDRFFLLRLDPRTPTRLLGAGRAPADPGYFFVG